MAESSQPSGSEEESFDEIFDSFCKVGDRNSEDIALRNVDKWFKQANIFSKDITTTDTAITFAKIGKNRKKLSKDEFLEMLEQLAQEKELDASDLQAKLVAAGPPAYAGTTRYIRGSIAADNMERLTDPSQYTGSHKERFDAEGKGRGLAGRYEVADKEGYVQGYKNKGTYGSREELDAKDSAEKKPKKQDSEKKLKRQDSLKDAEKKLKWQDSDKDAEKKPKKQDSDKDTEKKQKKQDSENDAEKKQKKDSKK